VFQKFFNFITLPLPDKNGTLIKIKKWKRVSQQSSIREQLKFKKNIDNYYSKILKPSCICELAAIDVHSVSCSSNAIKVLK